MKRFNLLVLMTLLLFLLAAPALASPVFIDNSGNSSASIVHGLDTLTGPIGDMTINTSSEAANAPTIVLGLTDESLSEAIAPITVTAAWLAHHITQCEVSGGDCDTVAFCEAPQDKGAITNRATAGLDINPTIAFSLRSSASGIVLSA